MLQAHVPAARAGDSLPSGGARAEDMPWAVESAPGDRVGTARDGQGPRRPGALPVRFPLTQCLLSDGRDQDSDGRRLRR